MTKPFPQSPRPSGTATGVIPIKPVERPDGRGLDTAMDCLVPCRRREETPPAEAAPDPGKDS